jgi:hypothetical protein
MSLFNRNEMVKLAGFQEFCAEEIALVMRVERKIDMKLNGAKSAYARQGNFTMCSLLVGDKIVTGVSKRAVGDIDRPEHAKRLAFRRAVENFTAN